MLLAGVSYVAQNPGPRIIVGLICAQTFVRGCVNVLILVTGFEALDANARAVGFMTAAFPNRPVMLATLSR
jgi:hypothetical protein